jgi:hypothetical protein
MSGSHWKSIANQDATRRARTHGSETPEPDSQRDGIDPEAEGIDPVAEPFGSERSEPHPVAEGIDPVTEGIRL